TPEEVPFFLGFLVCIAERTYSARDYQYSFLQIKLLYIELFAGQFYTPVADVCPEIILIKSIDVYDLTYCYFFSVFYCNIMILHIPVSPVISKVSDISIWKGRPVQNRSAGFF